MSPQFQLAAQTPELITAILTALQADQDLQAWIGNPARIMDGELPAPAFPYIALERHETEPTDTVEHRGFQHSLHFAAYIHNRSAQTARNLVSALWAAVERLKFSLSDQRVVLVLPTYGDVLRTKNQRILRGVLRVKLYTEEL